MRRSNLFNLKTFRPLLLATLTILSLGYNVRAIAQEDGAKLFQQNCATCHFPDKDMTGPALQGARDRWIANSSEDNFYAWIKNSAGVIASGDGYANELYTKWKKVAMPAQPVDNAKIDAIFEYVESYVPPVAAGATEEGAATTTEESSSTIWWIIAVLLIIVIFTVGGVKGQLANVARRQEGEAELPQETVSQSARRWAWENRGWFGVTCFIVMIVLLVMGMWDLMEIGVVEGYKPEQPIAYSHKLHAGDLGIDCKYCHHQVTKSQHAGIPSVNVCMNCHKTVNEGSTTGTEEIAKIYAAAGWDPVNKMYTGVEKPIKWIKVHDLPDHVYFNHSQHVVVGGLDCKACHGDMRMETVARVMTTEDLNAVGTRPGDDKRVPAITQNEVKFTRPTLTMGWCIECHQQSSVDIAGANSSNPDSYYGIIHQRLLTNKETYQSYLEDDIVTVAELGGMECAKCHY